MSRCSLIFFLGALTFLHPLVSFGQVAPEETPNPPSESSSENPPEKIEQVGDARWTSSLGFTSRGQPREEEAPASGAVLLEAPVPGSEQGRVDTASPLSALPHDHFDLAIGVSTLQPTNYGEEDQLLKKATPTFGMGLGFRWETTPIFGLILDFDFELSPPVNFDDLVTITYMTGTGALGGFFTFYDGETFNLRAGGAPYVGVGFAGVADDTGAFRALYGARLFSALTMSIFTIEPTYRWLHTGVNVHYLGAKGSLRLKNTLGMTVTYEQRVASYGGVDSADDLATAFVMTAPVKSKLLLSVNFLF